MFTETGQNGSSIHPFLVGTKHVSVASVVSFFLFRVQ